jgi:L-lactate dehydrogenase complex protein LldG
MTTTADPPRRVDPLVQSFAREATAAGAVVHGPATIDEAFAIVARLVLETGTSTVLAWPPEALGVPDGWLRLEALGVTPLSPTLPPDISNRLAALAALGEVEVGLTGAVGALADTGTIVVASGPGRPRLAWLLPSRHIALVDTQLVHADMHEYFDTARAASVSPPAHLAFVTGPSRTADIELTLTRGVHGPRDVHIILVAGGQPGKERRTPVAPGC